MLSDAAEGLRWADKPSQTSAAHGLTDKCLYPDYDMHAAKWIQMFMTHWFVLYQLLFWRGLVFWLLYGEWTGLIDFCLNTRHFRLDDDKRAVCRFIACVDRIWSASLRWILTEIMFSQTAVVSPNGRDFKISTLVSKLGVVT